MSFNPFSRFGQAADPDVVDFGDLEEAVSADAWTVVDVREPHEFAVGHIPNALNLPLSSFDPGAIAGGQAGGSHLPGRRTIKQCPEPGARSIGRADVRHYAGGMNGWRSHGGDVTL